MGDVIPFKRPEAKGRQKGSALCRSGFHKWEPVKETPFDVKGGKLVTRWRCKRCGEITTKK